MATSTTKTNKPINPRGNDQSPKGYNRAALYSGKALSFDGVNDYVDGGTLDITGYTQMSMSFYFKAHSTTSDWRLISIRYIGSDDIRIFHATSIGAGKLSFALDDGTPVTFSEDFDTNEWYHVVMTHDGTTLKAYFNGVLVQSAASDFNYSGTNGLFYIGRYTGGTFSYYDGEFANYKLFNTALTPAQVSDLYNNPEKIVPTGVADSALKLWLPMQEGAGTTAYDGSGNGNHGTISGATYVNGVGAPVAQSAVIDWNKGVNKVKYSEEFDDSTWQKTSAIVTADDTTAPDGSDTAEKIAFSATGSAKVEQYVAGQNQSKTFTVSVWAKVASGTEEFLLKCTQANIADHFSDTLTVTTDWQRFTFTKTFSASSSVNTIVGVVNDTDAEARDIYFWGFQLEEASSVGPYVRTGATAQTSPVLLPQGLTTGRDITGVNLFENVRKQGALNLDGNSWAEIHDNASLDFGTGAFTLEAWAKVKFVAQGSSVNCVFGLGGTISSGSSFIFVTNSNAPSFYYGTSGSTAFAKTEGDWVHIVGVYDETNATIYINATQEDQDARTATTMTNDLVKMIGRDSTTFRYYNDQIAQPRIYNRALTAEEVQRNYNAGKNIYK